LLGVNERNDGVAEGDIDGETTKLVAFIEAQTKRLKKIDPAELSALKLNRAAAALADMTDETAPDAGSAVFLTAWKRADTCHHFWGPTVGQERFCTKCQIPHSADAPDDGAGAPRRSR
jgi:hypothetical protein